MKSKITKHVTKNMEKEKKIIDERISKMIENSLAQMRTKMIQLEATNVQLQENNIDQVS